MSSVKILTQCEDRDSAQNYGRTCLQMFPKQPESWCDACLLRYTRGVARTKKNPR